MSYLEDQKLSSVFRENQMRMFKVGDIAYLIFFITSSVC